MTGVDAGENREYPGDAPTGEEVPVVAWPLLWRERLGRRVHRSDRYAWWVLWTVLAGLFATGCSITIVAVSLDRIASDLHSDTNTLTWVVTGPLLAIALSMPLFGKLGDLFGHRRLYLGGLLGFAIGSVATALAWNAGSLVMFRVLAAFAGAATGPSSMALIMRAFRPGDRVKAMGWWSLVGAGAPVIGLVAGGPLVAAFGWRVIFFAQAPIALAAVGLGVFVVRETPARRGESIDVAGLVTLSVTVVSLLLGLNRGPALGWSSPVIVGCFALVPIGLVAFIQVERHATHPIIPLEFFTRRNFSASLVAQCGAGFAYMGGFIVTPLLMQQVFGFSLQATSLAMICRPATYSTSSPIAGYLTVRVGERRAAVVGTLLVTCSLLVFALASSREALPLVFVGMCLSGLGAGTYSPALVTSVANAVSDADQGVANAAQQMVAQIGQVAGIQVLQTIQASGPGHGPFVWAYLAGALGAAVGVAGAACVRSTARHASRRVAASAA